MSEEASPPLASEIAKEKRTSSSSLMASEKEKKASSSSPLGAAAKLKPTFPSKLMLSGSASEPVLRSALARRRSDKGSASMAIAPMSITSRGGSGAVRRLGSGELPAQSPSNRRRRSVTTVMRQGTNGDLGTPKSAKCITPYGLIYGRPPSHFNFDRNGKMKVTPEGMEAEKEGFEPLSPKVGGFAVVKEATVSLQVAGLAAPMSPIKVLSPKSRFQGAVRAAMRESRRPNAAKVGGPAKSA